MTNNKKDLKESPMQAIPTPKSILNYKDDEVVAAIKQEVGKNKDFTILRITHQANQYYNVVISYIVPDEDWSFELDKYRYIQQLHTYRVELFTALSKLLPVVNVNLLAFDFIKGNDEIKFCLTILLSDTNNKDWVTGRRKQTIDQRERMKLLQTESKKPKKIDPEKQQEQAKESALEKLIDIIEKSYKGIKNENEFLKFYSIITGRRKPRGYDADGWFKDYEGQARDEIKTSIEWIHDIEEAKLIIQKMVKYGIMKPVVKESENLKEYYYIPSKIREREFHFPFKDFKQELFDAIDDEIIKQDISDLGIEDIEDLMSFHPKLIKDEWYEGNSVENTAKLIVGKLKHKKKTSYEPTEDEGSIAEDVELDYEFAPSNVPGTPTTDEDFLECDGMTKSTSVKESELIEGKIYSLFESNGLIVDTVQFIQKQDGKFLFEKSATGRKIKLSKNDVLSCIKKMKKKVIKEGWKMRDEISVPDAFKAAESARQIPGVISANAITQDKLSITYDGRKLDGETLKIKLS